MRPRNAREKAVMSLYAKLPELSKAQLRWVTEEVVEKRIYTSGRKCWCTHCGKVFNARLEGDNAVCPHCGTKAEVIQGRHTKYKDFCYVQFFHRFKGYQVIRYSLVRWSCERGEEPAVELKDVIQKWCHPGRPMVTLGASLMMLPSWRACPYSYYSDGLSVKPNHSYYFSEWMKVRTYPRMSLLPVYEKHLGKHPDFDELGFYAPTLLGDIFGCPYLEKLWKDGKTEELSEMWHLTDELNKYWPSVKIALRHGYKPEHWISYFDYLKALKFLHYDMHSPRYVAPPDWDEIHDLVMRQYRNRVDEMNRKREQALELKRALWQEEQQRRSEEEAKTYVESFKKRIEKYEHLQIENAEIVILPLRSIEEFKEEGEEMHHCVFSMGYYKKPSSLILSARDKSSNNRIETIEVSLEDYTVRQSMGKCNHPTAKHEMIVGMVKDSMSIIRKMSGSRAVNAR